MTNTLKLGKLEPAIPIISNVLGVSRRSAYRLIHDRLIPVVRVGRQFRIDQSELAEWIQKGGAGCWRRTREPYGRVSDMRQPRSDAGVETG